MKYKILNVLPILLMFLTLIGCLNSESGSKNSTTVSSTITTDGSDVSYEEKIINISEAEATTAQEYIKTMGLSESALQEYSFTCETIKIIDKRIYYQIRGSTDNDSHRVTFGWFFVDVYIGTVYNAGPGINELIPLSA